MEITEQMDEIMQPTYVEGVIHSKVNPDFGFLGLFDKTNLNGSSFYKYFTDRTTAEDEIIQGILSEPVEIEEGAQLPQIEVTGIQNEIGNTTQLGFEMKFTEEVTNNNLYLNHVNRTYSHAAYAMQRLLNRWSVKSLIENASADTIDLADGAWSGSEKIDDDVKGMQRAFEKVGYPYQLSQMYVGKDAYYGAQDYYDAMKVNGFDPSNVHGSRLYRIHELEKGLLGFDPAVKPAEWFYNVSKNHNKLHDEFGSFINVHRVENDEKPFWLKLQMWVEVGFAVTEPDAVLYQPGI